MLQYFSETIINDANTVSVKENTKTKEKFLLIEGVGLYRPEDIKKIYLRKFQPEVKEKLVKTLELGDLAVGDVVGNPGMDRVCRSLRYLKKKTEADFVIVNGENSAEGNGILP
mgnify:CR=1 FL=1